MSLLDKKTAGDAVRLLIFILVTTIATGFLVVTIGNISFAASKQYKAVFSDATGVTKGDDVRVAGVKVGSVKGVDIVDRTRALVTFKVDKDQQLTDGTNATIRYRNLVGQRYISLAQGVGGPGRAQGGRHDPAGADQPGPGPDGAVQRLQAAVRRAVAGRHQQAVLRDRHGLPGRGRHPREPAVAHRVGDQHAGQPRQGDRVADREPQPGDGDHRQPGRAALRPADQAAPVRLGPLRRPAGDPRLAGLDLRAGGADLRPGHRHPAVADHRRQAAQERRRQPGPQQGRDRPGPAGAADQADQGRSYGDVRLVLQLLPLQLQGSGQVPRGLARSRSSRSTTPTNSPRCDLG